MYGNDEVRFCEHCVKNVHDLSAMTRKAAEKFVTNANGSICVRYARRPDGKVQTAGDKLYQISARASRVAAGVFGASLTLASSVYAQSAPAGSGATPERVIVTMGDIAAPLPREKSGASISGTVTDPNGAVIPNADVVLTEQKTGAVRSMKTNDDGGYLFPAVAEGTYQLEFRATNFQVRKIENINFKDRIDAKFDTTLSISAVMMGVIVVSSEYENQLVRSVQQNDFERVKSLVAQGINVNEKDNNGGITALHVAVRKADLKTITMLLELGAKVNLRDERGRTAMMQIGEDYESEESPDEESAESGDNDENEGETEEAEMAGLGTRIFELLISHGAKVNLRDSEGFTALMYAARSENPLMLKLLLSHRANVNTQAKNGRTALMEAANEGELENVRILLQAGADVNLKDDEGETAMSMTSDPDIEELLLSFGAKPEEPRDH